MPARLDQIDAWIAEGLLNGPDLNAADFQIAANLAAMLLSVDAAPFVLGRPAEALARRVAPDYTGSVGTPLPDGMIPKALPAEWLTPLRLSDGRAAGTRGAPTGTRRQIARSVGGPEDHRRIEHQAAQPARARCAHPPGAPRRSRATLSRRGLSRHIARGHRRRRGLHQGRDLRCVREQGRALSRALRRDLRQAPRTDSSAVRALPRVRRAAGCPRGPTDRPRQRALAAARDRVLDPIRA